MPPSLPISAEMLLDHATGLRGLARALLRDPHAAEDVVQDTWIVALERPPHELSGLGGWLQTVARGLALKRRRGEGRRARREESVAREEHTASVVDDLAQRESLRSVVEAVLALDEPYQSAVWMRYYQDLPPREIATRLDVPLATVESRLHRARGMLRQRLDGSHGDRSRWARALLLATGLDRETAAASAATTGIPLGGFKMIATLASGLVAAAWMWAGWTQEQDEAGRDPTARREGVAAEERSSASAAKREQEGQGSADRERIPGEAASTPTTDRTESATPRSFVLEGLVVDEQELPYAGAHVFLALPGHPFNDWGETELDGSFRMVFESEAETLPLVLYVSKSGLTSRMQLVELAHDRPTAVRVLAARRRHDEATRGEIRKLEEQLVQGGGHVQEKALFALMYPSSFRPEPRFDLLRYPASEAHFQWPTVASLDAAKEKEKQLVSGIERIAIMAPGSIRGTMHAVNRPATPVRVTGTVLAADGTPAARARVSARSGQHLWKGRTREDGSFELAIDPKEPLELQAGGGDFGLSHHLIEPTEDGFPAELRWETTLDRGREVQGNLFLDRGEDGLVPLPGTDWIVEARSRDGSALWADQVLVPDSAQVFRIPNVGDGVVELFLREKGAPALARHLVPNVDPRSGATHIVLTAEDLKVGGVRLEIVDEKGEPVENAEVRLFQRSTGLGVWLKGTEGAYELHGLAPGAYSVSAGTHAHGFVDVGTRWVSAGDEPLDLGRVTLRAPGTLAWDPGSVPAAMGGDGWYLVRIESGCAVIVTQEAGCTPFSAALPAGHYELRVVEDGKITRVHPVEIRPGTEAKLSAGG